MTAPVIDAVDITLEDIAPPCELMWDDPLRSCDNSAEWVGLTQCCGSPRIMCDEHRVAYSWPEGSGHEYGCRSCGAVFSGPPWASLEKI